MIRNIFDALTAIDAAITEGLDNAVAFAHKVKDNEDSYSLKLDLPGFEKEEIEIDIIDKVLNLKAKNAEGTKTFTFYVPKDINKDAISATLKNGQLIITMPKTSRVPASLQKIRIS